MKTRHLTEILLRKLNFYYNKMFKNPTFSNNFCDKTRLLEGKFVTKLEM